MKWPGLTGLRYARLAFLGAREGRGIPGVVVKCVEIRRNPRGEGGALARN